MISMVERGRASPSIGTLVAIASALRVPMSELFDGDDEEDVHPPVRRRGDQPTYETASGVMRRLVQNDVNHGVEIAVNEYEPATASSATATHHAGVEYGMVMEGTLVVELDGSTYELQTGDSIAYESSVPHRILNSGHARARTVWLNLER